MYDEKKTIQGWTVVEDDWPRIPEKPDFERDPQLYVILTRKGKVLVAYPEYADGSDDPFPTDDWHAPSVGRVYQSDVIAYKQLDIPWVLASKMLDMPGNRNKAFRKIYGRLGNA